MLGWKNLKKMAKFYSFGIEIDKIDEILMRVWKEFSSVQNAWKNATNNIIPIPTLQCNDMNIMNCKILFIFIMIGKKTERLKGVYL